jgi:Uma2 family endonuclease
VDTELCPWRSQHTAHAKRLVEKCSLSLRKGLYADDNGEVANNFAITPDWTVEILSPDQSQTKVVRNILHCLAHGTQMGWLIDPEEKVVFVYFPDRTIMPVVHCPLHYKLV